MIEPVFSGHVYPNAAFDFLSGALDDRVSLSRADATATRVNGSGLIEAVLADVPRFDYDPITGGLKGVLIEEQRENLFLQSAFASDWNPVRSSLSPNEILAPDGTVSGAKLIENTQSSTSHRMGQSATYVAGNTYTISTYAKAGERSAFAFRFFSTGFGVSASQFFDLTNGVLLNSVTGISASITPAGNGWYRCTATRTATTNTTSATVTFDLSIGTTFEYDGDGVSGAYFWGAQLEVGSFPTSHIPTGSTTVTRNADVALITGANFDGFWQSGKGSALVRALPSTVLGICPVLQFDDATADNIIALRGNAANPELYVRTGGVDQAQIDAGTIAAGTSYRLAGAWAANDCAASFNSGTPVLDGVATIPTVTQARIGSDGTNYLNGHIEAIEYYDERLPSASLQVLSSQAGRNSIIGSVFRDSIIS